MPKSAQKRQSKSLKGTGIKGRPRNDGSPPIQKAQREVVLARSPPRDPAQNLPVDPPKEGEVHEAAFEVIEAETIREALDTNGIALVNDAYRRAARLQTPFDQAVYLTLLGKAHPMAQVNAKDKGLPGSKKKQLKALERIISGQMQVEDAEYRTISGPDGPGIGAQAQEGHTG